jgi:hypothetical protein
MHVSRETYLTMQDWNDSNPEAAPDSSLVRAARAGDRAAYGELYRRFILSGAGRGAGRDGKGWDVGSGMGVGQAALVSEF